MANIPTTSWDESTSFISNSTNVSQVDDKMRTILTQIREIIKIDHEMDYPNEGQDSNWGMHKVIRLLVQASNPTISTNEGALYTKDVSNVAELHWKDEDGNVKQLTSGGLLKKDLVPTSEPASLSNGMMWVE